MLSAWTLTALHAIVLLMLEVVSWPLSAVCGNRDGIIEILGRSSHQVGTACPPPRAVSTLSAR